LFIIVDGVLVVVTTLGAFAYDGERRRVEHERAASPP
jgi:hypothetical protein